MTTKDLERLQKEGKIQGYTETGKVGDKQSKYRNVKVERFGIKFDSIKEANRYSELRLLKQAGEIYNLFTQVPFELNEGGTHSLKYRADFTYQLSATDELIVEDAKGYRTATYKKKKRLMLKVRGITIKEV